MRMLEARDFPEFFRALYGFDPFPWQLRLVERIESQRRWPSGLGVPTGSGKTSAIDIAVFCLARDLSRAQEQRMMPTRIVFVVDRRIIVDAAYDRARVLSENIQIGESPIVAAVREALATVAVAGFPVLHVERLRGGVPRERDWTPSPAHATVLLSTVDQVGSRLLFRGYGVSESMRPVHAGLLGTDAIILLDEVHLSEPFRQTLRAVEKMRGDALLPWAAVELSATPRSAEGIIVSLSDEDRDILSLSDEDRHHPVLYDRLKACKPADIVDASGDMESFAERFVQEAIARSTLGAGEHARILVIVNRVALARLIYEKLRSQIGDGAIPVTLLIGRSRDIDSDKLRKSILERAGNRNKDGTSPDHQPYFLVATQTIEAGADVDFDVLITQLAPLDTLRQRFGRLDRSGSLAKIGRVASAAIIASRQEVAKGSTDSIYGDALHATWEWLRENVDARAQLDFGIDAMDARLSACDPKVRYGLSSPALDAPTLMPSYIRMLEQTRPTPLPDLPIDMFLHGPNTEPAEVLVVWRGDIPAPNDELGMEQRIATILDAMPPRAAEAISLPVWVARRWLFARDSRHSSPRLADVGDTPGRSDNGAEDARIAAAAPAAWRWKGDEGVAPVAPNRVRPGDVLVVPSAYGGCDEFGWAPGSNEWVADVADAAALPYFGSSFAVRLHPLLVKGEIARDQAFPSGDLLDTDGQRAWRALLDAVGSETEPREIIERLSESAIFPSEGPTARSLKLAFGQLSTGTPADSSLIVRAPYSRNAADRSTGFVIIGPRGLPIQRRQRQDQIDLEASTEDDERSTLGSGRYLLSQHSDDVEIRARETATQLRLAPSFIDDIAMAGWFHDAGKSDSRFQRYLMGSAWLREYDPLAKSIEPRDRQADRRARSVSALPERWRHEALSVRVARAHERFEKANDPELVLWLIGVHHGWGRPLFPHDDPLDGQAREIAILNGTLGLGSDRAPHSPEFGFEVVDPDGIIEVSWSALGRRVSSRYGAWTVALFETIVRLADHRASAVRTRVSAR